MLQSSAPRVIRKAALTGALLAFLMLTVGCAGSASQVAKTAPATPEAQFDQALQANLKAAEKHFWEVIDCENRDQENGLPTTKGSLPGATRTFLESAGYTLYSFFPKQGLGQSDLHAFVRARIAAYATEGNPDDSPSIEVQDRSDLLSVTIHPAQNAELPWGNPCAQAKP